MTTDSSTPTPADRVPFRPETWPVDADGDAPTLCTVCGTPTRYGSRHTQCAPGWKAPTVKESLTAPPAAAEPLSDALRALIRAYVNLLENGRDRIRMLGGECDDVPTMERSDPHLRAARAALSTHAAPARNGGETGEKRCQYCDGTGDVHGIDGEWRGACDCGAAQVNSTWNDVRREAVAIAGRRGLGDLLAAVHNYGAACARAAQPPAEQAAREVSEQSEAQIDVARDFAGLPRHIPVAGGAVYDLLPGLCRMVEHLRRASAHPTAPQPASAQVAADAVSRIVHLRADRERRIYIAGPMTGLPEFNFPAFNAAAARLRTDGWHVENPAEHGHIAGAEWSDYLRWDLSRVVTVAAVYLLPGWPQSKGATLEVTVARALGLAIICAPGAEDPSAQPAAEPVAPKLFGTVVKDTRGMFWFYPPGQPPYRDTAAEVTDVYSAPGAAPSVQPAGLTEAGMLQLADGLGTRWQAPDEEGISFEKSQFFEFCTRVLAALAPVSGEREG
jgi:hypothetical protein